MPDKPQTQPASPESVSAGYIHRDKFIELKQRLKAGPRRLKWYDIGAADLTVPAEIHDMARVFLKRRAREGGLDQLSDFGFVILHRCGEHFYLLIACRWRGNNEVWETVFAKGLEDLDFRDSSCPEPHPPTFCVWELGRLARAAGLAPFPAFQTG